MSFQCNKRYDVLDINESVLQLLYEQPYDVQLVTSNDTNDRSKIIQNNQVRQYDTVALLSHIRDINTSIDIDRSIDVSTNCSVSHSEQYNSRTNQLSLHQSAHTVDTDLDAVSDELLASIPLSQYTSHTSLGNTSVELTSVALRDNSTTTPPVALYTNENTINEPSINTQQLQQSVPYTVSILSKHQNIVNNELYTMNSDDSVYNDIGMGSGNSGISSTICATLHTPVQSFGGFQTGSGKTVQLSAVALQRAKQLIDDIDTTAQPHTSLNTIQQDNIVTTKQDPIQSSVGSSLFSTASGRPMKPSTGSVIKGAALLSDTTVQNNNTVPTVATSLFTRASGQAVTVSAQAQQSASALIATINNDTNNPVEPMKPNNHRSTRSQHTSVPSLQYNSTSIVLNNVQKHQQPMQPTPLSTQSTQKPKQRFRAPRRVPTALHKPAHLTVHNNTKQSTVHYHTQLQLPARPFDVDYIQQLNTQQIQHVSLPQHAAHSIDVGSVLSFGVEQSVIDINSVNAIQYCFNVTSYNQSYIQVGCVEMHALLLQFNYINSTLCTLQWVRNHYRWIVWKLAAYSRQYPQYMSQCFTYTNVLQQLLYRYKIEFQLLQRSYLRKALERDDIPNRYVVLCVASIGANCMPNPAICDSTDNATITGSYDMELTDGWYSIPTTCDTYLQQYIASGSLYVGQKLRIHNATFMGGDDATTPLENTTVYLNLCVNSVRRAVHNAKLGIQRHMSFATSLKHVKAGGGDIPAFNCMITHIYPLLYTEQLTESLSITRNQLAEERAQNSTQLFMEKQPYTADNDSNMLTKLERAVKPMLKVKIVEITPDSRSIPQICILTVYNNIGEYIESLREGQLYTVLNARASKIAPSVEYSSRRPHAHLLNIYGSQTCQIHQLQQHTLTGQQSTDVECHVRHVQILSSLSQIPVGSEFDLVCAVVYASDINTSPNEAYWSKAIVDQQTNRNRLAILRTQTLRRQVFITDCSGELGVIHWDETEQQQLCATALSLGIILHIRSAFYNGFDSKHRVYHLSASIISQVKNLHNTHHLARDLTNWCNQSGQTTLLTLQKKATDLAEGCSVV